MSSPVDPFEFVKNLWGQMAVPGFGLTGGMPGMASGSAPQMPSFDAKELETRLAQLKQVKQWLELNLNVMNLQINTLEMQLATMSGFKDASDKMFGASHATADKWAETVGGRGSSANTAGAAAPAAPWMDPQAWLTFMQTQAAATQQAAQKAMKDSAAAMQSAASGGADGVARGTKTAAETGAATPAPKKSPRARTQP